MEQTFRTKAEVNLDALANNIREIKSHVGTGVKVMASVKADAYGHGVYQTSKTLIENGADYLAVAFADEAVQLRNYGILAPVLILGYTNPCDMETVVKYNAMPSIYDINSAKLVSETAKKFNKTVKIHIKLDTGMHRIGFECTDEALNEIYFISKFDNIEIEGIFTHFSCADDKNDDYTFYQFNIFKNFVEKLEKSGINIPLKHVCNSAATIKFPQMHLDMVRTGIINYGLYPSEYVDKNVLNLIPVMSIKSAVTRIQYIRESSKISYGGIYTAPANTKIATVSIGYADGLLRGFSNKSHVIAGGKYANIIGRICMDQCMIDVTNVNNINIGDEIVIVGNQSGKSVTFDELADILNTINYELICLVGKRVPRVYLANGKIKDILNYLG